MTWLVAAILAGVALEAMALVLWHRRTGRGPAPRTLLPNLAAGAMLLVAMLLALAGFAWPFVAASLGIAGICHLIDLRERWI